MTDKLMSLNYGPVRLEERVCREKPRRQGKEKTEEGVTFGRSRHSKKNGNKDGKDKKFVTSAFKAQTITN
jgi:hypothetical protein